RGHCPALRPARPRGRAALVDQRRPQGHGREALGAGMSALIELAGVGKDYVTTAEVVRALDHVDLSIEPGEFVAIVGTSGSGKSTLMNILGCLDRPTRGVYRLAGVDVTERSADERAVVRNRLIGFVFQ